MSDLYAVIGNPIAQSKSPMIHGLFAQATGQHMAYTKLECSLGGFNAAVDAFRGSGGKGLNITAPFKLDGDHVYAENFDGVGLVRDVTHNLGIAIQGQRVLMLGAGGAARGALLPFLEQQPLELVIVNRTLHKAFDLASSGAQHGRVRASSYAELSGQTFDVVFNATSASLTGDLPPVPAGVFAHCALAYEFAYGKGLTPFLRLAQNAGAAQLADGVGMLAEQAAEAFYWWRGVRPDTQAAIKALAVPLV